MQKYGCMPQEIRITGNDAGQRLDRYLRKTFAQIPLSTIYKFLRQKKVRISRAEQRFHGKRENIIEKGDILNLYFTAAEFGEPLQKKQPDFSCLFKSTFFKQNFRIHFADQYFFVAEKPAGISVHPGTKTPWGLSLIDLFIAHVHSQNSTAPEPKLVHRLDKETSGLILISRNDATLRKLNKILRAGEIEKKYLALVKGKMKKEKGKIDLKLLRTEGSKYTKIRVSQRAMAQSSRTFYTVQQYFLELNASLVEVILDTGRMHQIRVHFASQGHPLAGDSAYGNFQWNARMKKKYGLRRQFLHAYQLAFTHPETGKKMRFVSQLPADLKKILPSE